MGTTITARGAVESRRGALLRSGLLIGAAVTAMAPAGVFAQVAAQPTPTEGEPARSDPATGTAPTGTLENSDIIVTAQKSEQRLLDVPVPVTALPAQALIQQNLVTLEQYYTRVPSLQYAGNQVIDLSIRGITTGGATNPTLAILIDDVPFGSSLLSGQSYIPDFDPSVLQQIEVLRGPQGTLYGASSLGGLIKYVTKQPSTTEFGGRIELGANTVAHGNEGHSFRGQVNVPIIQDKIGLSISGFYRRDPAWVDNIDRGTGIVNRDANTSKAWGGRAALVIKPVDRVTISLSAIRQDDRTKGSGSVDFVSSTDFSGVPGDLIIPSQGTPTRSRFDVYSGKVDVDLGFGKLTSVSGWNKAITVPVQDLTIIFGNLLKFFYPGTVSTPLINAHRATRFSQEVRLAGTGSRLDWLVGGFYSIEHSDVTQTLSVANASGATFATPYFSSGPTAYREYAGFGSLTLHVTDRIDLQAGGRYGHNKQINTGITVIDDRVVPIFGPTSMDVARQSDSVFTWSVSPSFRPREGLLLYARVANGYRPGGTNPIIADIPRTYNNDTVINYEVGMKGTAFDKRVEFDLSLFQIDWRHIQLLSTDAVSDFSFTTNGGKARSRGVEAQGEVKLWNGASLSGNATLTDATLRSPIPIQTGAVGLVGNAGDRLPTTAKFTGNISFDQVFKLASGNQLSFGANYSHIGDRYSDFANSDPSATGFRLKYPGYSQLDLRAAFQIDGGWRLSAYVRNTLDKRGVTYATDRGGTVVPTGHYIQPRTIGFLVSGAF